MLFNFGASYECSIFVRSHNISKVLLKHQH